MKHKFVIPALLILVIGIACSLTGSPEPVADEGRIATSVAETVAAQTNQEIEPTNTPASATSTPLPTVTPTPTQNLTVLPTATSNPTVPPTAAPAATETPALLAVGDTIYFDRFAMTLVSANVGSSYEYGFYSHQAREGYTYVYFDFEYVATKFDPKTPYPFNFHTVQVKDKDQDIYGCQRYDSLAELIFRAPGYGGYFRMHCEAPLTAISSLDNVQLELMPVWSYQGTPYVFELDRQTQNPVEISAEKEREKHFPMDQPFTVICGTQYQVEYVLANPRWSNLDLVENKWGFEMFSVDLLMTNPGKTNATNLNFSHALFFFGMDVAARVSDNFPPEDIVHDFPIPGGTGMYRLHFALPPTDIVPLIADWPQRNYEKDCELKIGNYVIADNPDYFVIEIQTTGG